MDRPSVAGDGRSPPAVNGCLSLRNWSVAIASSFPWKRPVVALWNERTERIAREGIASVGKRPRSAPATDRSVRTRATLAAEPVAIAKRLEQWCVPIDVGNRPIADVAGRLRQEARWEDLARVTDEDEAIGSTVYCTRAHRPA